MHQIPSKYLGFIPTVTLAICLISTIVSLTPFLSSLFIYDRFNIYDGEIWRFFTGHFTHHSKSHLLFNLVALLISGSVIERFKRIDLCWIVIFSSLFISLYLFIFKTDMIFYAGLSGITYGLIFYCGLVGLWNPKYRFLSLIMLFFIIMRIFQGYLLGASNSIQLNNQGFEIMHESHIIGCMVVLIYFCIVRLPQLQSLNTIPESNLKPKN
jgi:rhomboid family GlyGly-CTERM serine protease